MGNFIVKYLINVRTAIKVVKHAQDRVILNVSHASFLYSFNHQRNSALMTVSRTNLKLLPLMFAMIAILHV